LPPAVGDCVAVNAPATAPAVTLSYGPCTGPHYGEIVQIFASPQVLPAVSLGKLSALAPASGDAATRSYLGLDQVLPRQDRGDSRRA